LLSGAAVRGTGDGRKRVPAPFGTADGMKFFGMENFNAAHGQNIFLSE